VERLTRRRRLSGKLVVATFSLALLAFGSAGFARASVGPAKQTGVFALLGGAPKIVSTFWAEHGAGLTATLEIRQFQSDGKTPILNYDVTMQKIIHLIVVRDDFATFAHLHPAFSVTSGTFSQRFTKESNHRYYVFADTTPRGIGQQVFRFTMESDGPTAATKSSLVASSPTATAGPYTVTLAKTTFAANQQQSLDVTIDKGGAPAKDLGSYLGAPAHCTFINTTTLAYLHVHPEVGNGSSDNAHQGTMPMNMSDTGPLLRLHVPALPSGIYKVWIEFRGGSDKVYTAPFTIAAS
jgi:hypothetical protein